jgi:hypothetical protein
MFFLTGPQRRCELLLKLSYDLHLASSRPPPPARAPGPAGARDFPNLAATGRDTGPRHVPFKPLSTHLRRAH